MAITLQSALKEYDKDFYSNLYVLLRIACKIPVTSCENERANSTLKNLKNFLQSSMGQGRLSALMLMHIHYNFPIDLDDVVGRFNINVIGE